MQCDLCGYPIRKDNVTGVCRSNIGCKREGMTRQRLRKKKGLVGTGSRCGSCGELLRAGNQSGYCSANADCNRQRIRLPAINTSTHDVRTYGVIPDRNRELQAHRRAIRAGVPTEDWSWSAVLERSGNQCYLCQGVFTDDDPAQADHVIPISRGGYDIFGNVAPAHKSCNSRKHDNVQASLNTSVALANMAGWAAVNGIKNFGR
jgi:5-methylcytosine-specific restriction endonuclease McrA